MAAWLDCQQPFGSLTFIRQRLLPGTGDITVILRHWFTPALLIWAYASWVCFLPLPGLLSAIARKRSFLWGLLPLGTLWFWDRLAAPEVADHYWSVGQLQWTEGVLLRQLHLPDDWPGNYTDAVLFLLGCLLITSGPISLIRWLLKLKEQRQAAHLTVPAPGEVWPPPPTQG